MSNAKDIKVVLVGDPDVGKTTLFNRFKMEKFVDGGDQRQTRKEAECVKTWQYEGEELSVRLYCCLAVLASSKEVL